MNDLDKKIIRALQGDLPIEKEPYKSIAKELGIEEELLLKRLEEMKEQGILRRIGAILNHRSVGFNANAMVAWCIEESETEHIGKQLALQREISHCYQRESFPNWPYNMYTMVHAETTEACEAVIKRIAETIGIDKYEALYSTKELKKTSFKYFME